MNTKWKKILYPVLVIGVGFGISSWLMANKSSSIETAQENIEIDPLADAPTVATVLATSGNYAPQLQLYSQLQSGQQVIMNSPAAAEVLNVFVTEGDSVEKGDVLVELDSGSLNRQVTQLNARRLDLNARRASEKQQYQNNVEALEVEKQLVAIAQRSVERLTNLVKQKLTSESDLENAERTLQNQILSMQNRQLAISRYSLVDQQYQAQLIELDSQIDQATEQLADATVTAPFAAKVSQVEIQIGASLNVGQTLLTLVDPGQQELVAWVSANALENIIDTQEMTGFLETSNEQLAVNFTHSDPFASAGSLRLFFSTEGAENSLVLNRYYRMWLDLPTQQAYAIPESAIYSNRFVYTVEGTELQRREVTVIGERFQEGGLWRLVSGDLDNQEVLVTRLQSATQGLAVRSTASSNALAVAGQ
jgi:multidrug efflux pump subunit AcrA (membrane-fusion protein)